MTTSVIAEGLLKGRLRRLGYRDHESGCEVVVTTPSLDPQMWQDYVDGAVRSYRGHGVEHALDFEQMRDGRSSSLLFAVFSDAGELVGGIRSQGPYERADQSHALAEWEGHPGQAALRTVLEHMVPAGLVELKAAWVADDFPARRALVACLSRTPIHAAMVLGGRYAMGTAAAHSVPGWQAAGGVVALDVPAVAYPDDRYLTRLVWWDRLALPASMAPGERRAVDDEAGQLSAPVVPTQESR